MGSELNLSPLVGGALRNFSRCQTRFSAPPSPVPYRTILVARKLLRKPRGLLTKSTLIIIK